MAGWYSTEPSPLPPSCQNEIEVLKNFKLLMSFKTYQV